MICPKCKSKNLHQLKDGRFLCRDCENIFVAVKEPELYEVDNKVMKVIVVNNKDQITLSKLFTVVCLCFGIWWIFSIMYNALTVKLPGQQLADEARQLREESEKNYRCSQSPNYTECMRKN